MTLTSTGATVGSKPPAPAPVHRNSPSSLYCMGKAAPFPDKTVTAPPPAVSRYPFQVGIHHCHRVTHHPPGHHPVCGRLVFHKTVYVPGVTFCGFHRIQYIRVQFAKLLIHKTTRFKLQRIETNLRADICGKMNCRKSLAVSGSRRKSLNRPSCPGRL